MTLGSGVFLSSLVLGTVVLYLFTRDRWSWRRIGCVTAAGASALILAAAGATSWNDARQERDSAGQVEENRRRREIVIGDHFVRVLQRQGVPDTIFNDAELGLVVGYWDDYKNMWDSEKPALWAIFALLLLLQAWWGLFAAFSQESYVTSLTGYLATFALVTPMYLIASAALPSPSDQTPDLARYYETNAAKVFGLITALWLISLLYHLLLRNRDLGEPSQVLRMVGIGAGALSVFSTNARFHAIVMVLMIAVLIAFFSLVNPQLNSLGRASEARLRISR